MKLLMLNVQRGLAQLNNMINQNPIFTIELSLEETNMVLAALQELPAKICNPLSEKIKTQAQAQIAAMQAVQQEPEVQKTPE
jgi:hypothetical protein